MRRVTRDRLLLPILLPVGGLSLIAAMVFGFSRVLLSVSHTAATATAITVAFGIMLTAVRVAALPKVRVSSLASMLGAVAGVAMLAGGIALAAIGPPEKASPSPTPAVTVPLVAPKGAAATGYAQTSLTFPADTPVIIAFDNQDTGVPHNVEIFTEDPLKNPGATEIFAPPGNATITGPATARYGVKALQVGTYFFHCVVHPTTMHGTITVGAAGGGGSPAPGSSGSAGSGSGAVAISAQGLRFSTDHLSLPASGTVTINFTNNDGGIPHNIGIYSADPATDPSATELFRGDLLTGPGSTTYTFAALPAGTYFFHCDVHSFMHGTVTVG